MHFGKFSQNIKNIGRVREILTVLTKHGFGYVTGKISKETGLRVSFKKRRKDYVPIPRNVRIRKVLEELGPTFIKFGQILSVRSDILPFDLCQELQKLQDKAPEIEYKKIEDVVENELGKKVIDVFEYIETTPDGAASLAQVHSAKLKNGLDVILKVQRPNIKNNIFSDIEILYYIAYIIQKYIEDAAVYDPVGMVDSFKREILKELDFKKERANIEKFQNYLKGEKHLYVPAFYSEFSTSRLLVMEKIKGYKISDIENIPEKFNKHQLALRIATLMANQIFEVGFFHADPHPGNIFITEKGQICFIDFGAMGNLSEYTRENLVLILMAVINRDTDEIIYVLKKIGAVEEEADTKKLETEIYDFIEEYLCMNLSEIEVSEMLKRILRIMSQEKMKIPADMFTLIISLITFETVVNSLSPDFNLAEFLKPVMKKFVYNFYSPSNIYLKTKRTTRDLLRLIYSLPGDAKSIIEKIKSGRAKIELEHKGLDNLIIELDRVSNRLSFAIIIASLIVGSSIIINYNAGPMIFGFSIPGIIGFTIAGIMGLWLAFIILKSGKF
ncbi:MAG: ABC1 kinase family protein [Candidatus Muiribacteriota bacterium]